jgi:excisionase family DNA binding protein
MLVVMNNQSLTEAGISNSGGFVKKEQVAEWLGVTTRTVDDYMRRGFLVYYKLGRTVRFKLEDVDEHLKNTCRIAGRDASSLRVN